MRPAPPRPYYPPGHQPYGSLSCASLLPFDASTERTTAGRRLLFPGGMYPLESRGANSSAPPHRSKAPVLERRCRCHCHRLPKPDSDREGAAPWWAQPVHAPCFVDRYFLWAEGSSNLSDHDQRGNPLVVSKRIKYIRQVGTTLRKTEHPNKPHTVLLVLY